MPSAKRGAASPAFLIPKALLRFSYALNFSNFVSQVRHDAGWIITIAPEESRHVTARRFRNETESVSKCKSLTSFRNILTKHHLLIICPKCHKLFKQTGLLAR
jgi:hypothetical protein